MSKLRKVPVVVVVLALAAEMAYIFVKGSKEVAKSKPGQGKDNSKKGKDNS